MRLGIRRAAHVKGSATHPSLLIQHLNQNALMEIPKTLSVGGVFSVYYDPRFLIYDLLEKLDNYKCIFHPYGIL